VLASAGVVDAQERLEPADVFGLDFATDPEIAPSGERIVYVRNSFDVMSDRLRSGLWIVSSTGDHRALTAGEGGEGSPRWSPDGERLLYASDGGDDGTQLWLRWMDGSGQEARLSQVTESPSELAWSPDGEWIAFTMFVPDPDPPFASMPVPPEGAEWAGPAIVIDDVEYRRDGSGYLRDGADPIFVLPATGGTARRLTSGPYDHSAPAWTPDGRHLIVTANRREDRVDHSNDTELWEVSVQDGSTSALTDRHGPDGGAAVSPDGRWIAYSGFDDELQGYQLSELTLMARDGSERRVLARELDPDFMGLRWSADGSAIYAQYDDRGTTKAARVGLDGSVEELWWDSSFDGRPVQGWVMKPPGFDPSRRYPLVLEIHGRPFANYGPRFTAEAQLYAAAGYVVLYANPRGSTSYGEEFGNLIHLAYPGRDSDDLMSGVDAVVGQGYADPGRVFVTGGSGGGVLTAWIVGKTDRFRAAVAQKPVIPWTSFVLTADASPWASHSIAARPSNPIRKVVHVLEWFARYGGEARPVS